MPNDPYLDKSVAWRIRSGGVELREPAYRQVADAIVDSGLATAVLQRIGSGKEADVYLCEDSRRLVALKAYRFYRTSHRGGSAMKLDSIGHRAVREYELLIHAWRNHARVPEPFRREENMFSMEFLGTLGAPAPILHHAKLRNPEAFFRETVATVERLADAGVVHTDLSPFNILVHRDLPWIIDLGACVRVDRLGLSPWVRLSEASDALNRGLSALGKYFRRYGVEFDVGLTVTRIVQGLDRFGVLG